MQTPIFKMSFFRSASQSNRQPKTSARRLFLESLERREMLSVSAGAEISVSAAAAPASSELVVNTSQDIINSADNLLSLREALLQAESGSVITFSSGLVGSTITLDPSLGTLAVSKSVTIDASSLCNPVTQSARLTVNANASAGESRRVFEVEGTEACPVSVTIIGLKITGGRTTATVSGSTDVESMGGGIYAHNADLTLDRCTITKNVARCDTYSGNAYASGGGVYLAGGSLSLMKCTVSSNNLYAYTMLGMAETCGGGIYADGAVTIINSAVTSHYASEGAGIYLKAGSLTMTGSSVAGNNSKIISDADDNVGAYGAGICAMTGDVVLRSSSISDNAVVTESVSGTADAYGGGIYLDRATLLMEDVTVSGNSVSAVTGASAAALGGGVYSRSSVTLVDVLVSGNNAFARADSAEAAGGALMISGGTLSAAGSTITACEASFVSRGVMGGNGGGVALLDGEAVFRNTILAENYGSSFTDLFLQNSTANAYNTLSPVSAWNNAGEAGVVNYRYDASLPLFTDPNMGDFTLAAGSQAIDRGNNAFVRYADGSPIDRGLDKLPRIVHRIVDLGAYEYQTGEPEQLDVPAGLNAVSAGGHALSVGWNAVAGASAYELFWTGDGVCWFSEETAGLSLRVDQFAYGAAARFQVRALGDGISYTNSDFSAISEKLVCPMDINGDGSISGLDRVLMGRAWLTEEGDENWNPACDIDGDGEITGLDRAYLTRNWLKDTVDDDLVYPQ